MLFFNKTDDYTRHIILKSVFIHLHHRYHGKKTFIYIVIVNGFTCCISKSQLVNQPVF